MIKARLNTPRVIDASLLPLDKAYCRQSARGWAISMVPGPFGRIGRGARFKGSASIAKLALLTADFSPYYASRVEAACSSRCKSHCYSNNGQEEQIFSEAYCQ
jgi:hypothetical protein